MGPDHQNLGLEGIFAMQQNGINSNLTPPKLDPELPGILQHHWIEEDWLLKTPSSSILHTEVTGISSKYSIIRRGIILGNFH